MDHSLFVTFTTGRLLLLPICARILGSCVDFPGTASSSGQLPLSSINVFNKQNSVPWDPVQQLVQGLVVEFRRTQRKRVNVQFQVRRKGGYEA
jgi:hypothetical protein